MQASFIQSAQIQPCADINLFKEHIWTFHRENRRSFAWREVITPYRVFVSEVMLQQTQTYRVTPKFEEFITELPSFEALASAQFVDVLRLWKGLGYNRRALNLQKAAQIIVSVHNGILPQDPALLIELPGIGPNTAGSLCAFAYNKPTVFIETNIKTVFIYHFFQGKLQVKDKQIQELVAQTVDERAPREWYYALMDYGVHLKKTVGNLTRLSATYTRQSKFEGSLRQMRGKILEVLLLHKTLPKEMLFALLEAEVDPRVHKAYSQLVNEGLIAELNGLTSLR